MKSINVFLNEAKVVKKRVLTITLGDFLTWYFGESSVDDIDIDEIKKSDILNTLNDNIYRVTDNKLVSEDVFKSAQDLLKWIDKNKDIQIDVICGKEHGDFTADFKLPDFELYGVLLVCMDDPMDID